MHETHDPAILPATAGASSWGDDEQELEPDPDAVMTGTTRPASTSHAPGHRDGAARERMTARQIAGRGVRDPRVLEAMRTVPRSAFVPTDLLDAAHSDAPLPIEAGQTISQPYIVALMLEALELGPGDRALEVGSGSGYAAAVMSRLCETVHAIERHEELVEASRQTLAELGYANVVVRVGDGTLGWAEEAPFDAILVSAGGPAVPDALREQLADGGRLVMPVGTARRRQRLTRVVRRGLRDFVASDLGEVAFVPLIGEQGWDRCEEEWF
jgi:protein-L-isoaspartate(D-aspartate) O-methyltransferase